jgi:hypothetical protein
MASDGKFGTYDSNLQMFCERPVEIDQSKLRFLRWLAEHGQLEHEVAGPSTVTKQES